MSTPLTWLCSLRKLMVYKLHEPFWKSLFSKSRHLCQAFWITGDIGNFFFFSSKRENGKDVSIRYGIYWTVCSKNNIRAHLPLYYRWTIFVTRLFTDYNRYHLNICFRNQSDLFHVYLNCFHLLAPKPAACVFSVGTVVIIFLSDVKVNCYQIQGFLLASNEFWETAATFHIKWISMGE